jgi:hypothetical protein
MADTTFEEASRCPKCKKPGEDAGVMRMPLGTGLPRGTTVHQIFCRNEGCEWFSTPWMVQVNPDGSVPAPRDHTGEAKVYVGFEKHDQEARDIKAALQAEKDASTVEGGAFIRRRP